MKPLGVSLQKRISMISYSKDTLPNIVQKGFLLGILLGLILVILGWFLVPTINFFSVVGACIILVVYGLVGFLGFPRIRPETLTLASVFGLIAGIIFAGEILLEYWILPKDNTSWGLIEFSSVFALYFLSGLFVSYRYKGIKHGILAAIVSAMLSSIIWLIFTLITFYIFRGTARQEFVFRAEGNFEDFARSGMKDFNTFIMEDFLGAGFFHLLLSPLLATILGTISSMLGKGIVQLRKY
jgi:hypothetical protein